MGDGSRIRSSLRFRTTERVSASLDWPQTDNAVTLGEGGGFILPASLAKRPRGEGLSCGLTCPSTASARNYARHAMSTIAKRPNTSRWAGARWRLPVGNDTASSQSYVGMGACDWKVRLNTPHGLYSPTCGPFLLVSRRLPETTLRLHHRGGRPVFRADRSVCLGDKVWPLDAAVRIACVIAWFRQQC
jgi:hypothetical protein